MPKTTVTSSGAGIGKIYPSQPMMSVSDTLFVFDLTESSLRGLKALCEETKWNLVTIYQIQNWAKLDEFSNSLRELIKYAIYKNQNLCDRVFVIARDEKYSKAADEIWPEEKQPIAKFRGREWPTEGFAKHFATTEGSGSISQSPEKIDPKDIIAWVMEFTYDEYESADTILPLDFDPEEEHRDPTEDDLPEPLDDDAVMVICGTDEEITETEVRYWYHHQVTGFPLQETHATPMNNLTASFITPQNTISCDCSRMVRAEIWYPPTPEAGGDSPDGE